MKRLLTILTCLITLHSYAQKTAYDYIKEGNEYYAKDTFQLAEKVYRQCLDSIASSYVANFNLGNALYRQDSTENAANVFEDAAHMSNDKLEQAHAYHNLGTTYLKRKEYQKSIEAFKNALRRNPSDEDTRYNLAYAQEMLKNQQQQQQQQQGGGENDNQNQDQQNQDQKDQKNKDGQGDDKKQQDQQGNDADQKDKNKDSDKKEDNGDKGNKDKEEQEKGNQEQDNKGSKGKDGKQKEGKPGKAKLTKEQAEKILKAQDQEESELRKAIRIKEEKTPPKEIEKNW